MISPHNLRFAPTLLPLALALACIQLSATVRINELVATQTHRVQTLGEEGQARVGTLPRWQDPEYTDGFWSTGAAPIGFGGSGLGTSIPGGFSGGLLSVYARREFSATGTEAASAATLSLEVAASDGYVVWINGREATRRNLGPPSYFCAYDQPAFREEDSSTVVVLGQARDWLAAGKNWIAIQVHRASLTSPRLRFDASLRLGTAPGTVLVPTASSWQYLAGHLEPSGGVFDPVAPELEFLDWIELHNTGPSPVNLEGWSLSDNPNRPNKAILPPLEIAPGGFLLLLASGLESAPAGSTQHHLPFSLSSSGETLFLARPDGEVADQVTFGPQSRFHTYARRADGSWGFSPVSTPGFPNPGSLLDGPVLPPEVSPPGGFHDAAVSVVLTGAPGAVVRYTIDGSEPAPSSALASEPVVLSQSGVLRARAFASGAIPSETVTHTYLIGEPEWVRNLPVVALSGDPGRAFFNPYGIFAKQGGEYIQGRGWTATGPDDYYLSLHRGRHTERTAHLEWFSSEGTPLHSTEVGVRMSASTASRPIALLDDLSGRWSPIQSRNKPSLNVYFRGAYGGPFDLPFLGPDSPPAFDSLRFRAGKNDIDSPFLVDELTRRLTWATGQPNSRGVFVNLFVNGIFRGYYNICERLKEPFFQHYHNSEERWDVIQGQAPQQTAPLPPFVVEEGDWDDFLGLLEFFRGSDLSDPDQYAAAGARLDVINFIDYLLPSLWAVTLDWHMNNWVAARERSAQGIWRFYVWDAEWGFNLHGWVPPQRDYVADWLTSSSPETEALPIPLIFTRLLANPDFRLLFADRVQKHFFGSGPLSTEAIRGLLTELRDPLIPVQRAVLSRLRPQSYLMDRHALVNYWLDGRTTSGDQSYRPHLPRNAYFFDSLLQHGLWPSIGAPGIEPEAGVLPPDGIITLAPPPQSVSIFYTTDGSDPRGPFGAVAGLPYTGPFVVSNATVVRARSKAGDEWSPLAEKVFFAPLPSVVFSEIMYHPPALGGFDGTRLEFLELHNPGSEPADLSHATFTRGIQFTFGPNSVLPPDGYWVLVSDVAAFLSKYPYHTVHGQYSGQLSNSGETVTLTSLDGRTLFSVTYSDDLPWPVEADGVGYSLVPARVGPMDNPDDPASWKRSAHIGGSPGSLDPATLTGDPSDPTLVSYFPGALNLGDDIWETAWFGRFFGAGFPWIFHFQHGWLYCAGDGDTDLWLFDAEMADWVYSSPLFYPFLYRHGSGAWLFYWRDSAEPRLFYDFGTDAWVLLPQPN